MSEPMDYENSDSNPSANTDNNKKTVNEWTSTY